MHIPDGFLDVTTAMVTYAIFLGYGCYVFRKVKDRMSPERVSLVSVLAAGVFAAQMLNWPIPGGTSLHFVGGALAGITLGPWFGFITIFLVLLVQCLVFHDGGITALGANVCNMAIIDVLVGYTIYRVLVKKLGASDSVCTFSAFLGGWMGITLAGIACGLEIGYSPSFPYGAAVTVPVMGGWHLILGLVEGAVTALTVRYLCSKAPQLVCSEKEVMK